MLMGHQSWDVAVGLIRLEEMGYTKKTDVRVHSPHPLPIGRFLCLLRKGSS